MKKSGRVKVWSHTDPTDETIGYLGEGTFQGRVPLTQVFSQKERFEKFRETLEEANQLSESDLEYELDNLILSFGALDHENRDTAMIELDSGETVYGCNVVWEPC